MSNIPAELKYVASHEWLRLEADGSAHRFAEHCRHPLRGRACGESTRLQHHDAATIHPWLVYKTQRNECGLAGTGWCDQHR